MADDRAAALAEAYKRGILPPEMKAAYEEATKRGLVAKPEPAKTGYAKMLADQANSPRWDVLGDIGRAASAGVEGVKEGFHQAFPSVEEMKAHKAESREKYGAVGGPIMDFVSTPEAAGLMKMPLSALATVASPVTGLLHSTLGSALSYLPFVDKKSADEMVDKSTMMLAPETMELGMAGGPIATANRAAASRSAQVRAMSANAQAAANNPVLVQARQAGYVFHPADVTEHPGFVADTASGLGGKIKTQQEASARNQQVTDRLAAQDLGLPGDTLFDDATFARVRKSEGQAYSAIEKASQHLPTGKIVANQKYLDAISNLDDVSAEVRADFPEMTQKPDITKLQDGLLKGEFSPKGGIEMIKRLRDDSRVNLKAWDDKAKLDMGTAQRAAANALEDLIDDNLSAAGMPDAVKDYRAARQTIAKSHDIEAAAKGGHIDARKLAALSNKRPFTGNLKLIADTAERYAKSMQMPSNFGGVEKRSILDTLTALGSGGAAFGGAWMHSPAVAMSALPLAVAPFARPLARSVALSERLQNRLAGLRTPNQFRPMIGQGAVPAVTGTNALRSMLPGIGTPPTAQPQPPQGQ